MSNMLQAKVYIEGTRPLFFHRFGPDSMPLEKEEKTGRAGNDPEVWRKTVMVTKDGRLYLEPTYAFATLREGSKYTKRNRASLLKPIVATLQVMDHRIFIDRFFPGYPNEHEFDVKTAAPPSEDSDAPVYLDIRGVINPTTKAHNIRYRIAASPGWRCEFTVLWDKTIISRNELEAVIIDAGKLVGIGNGRAIGMGRFSLEAFDVQD